MTAEERSTLEGIVLSETPARAKRAEILLLADEGPDGPAWKLQAIEAHFNLNGVAGGVLSRAVKLGPVQAAIGLQSKKRVSHPGSHQSLRSFSSETEDEIAAAFATGEFTKLELARAYGVCGVTIGNAIKRANGLPKTTIPDEGVHYGPPRKLSPKTEQSIFESFAQGEFTKSELARRHGVSFGTVQNILMRHKTEDVDIRVGNPRKLPPETEDEITAAFATGEFTKAELSRRHGVVISTISKILSRQKPQQEMEK